MQQVEVDIGRLRKDLESYYMSGFIVTGFGAAFVEASDVKRASDEVLIEMAQEVGFDLSKYIV